jgi:hypothetical protein
MDFVALENKFPVHYQWVTRLSNDCFVTTHSVTAQGLLSSQNETDDCHHPKAKHSCEHCSCKRPAEQEKFGSFAFPEIFMFQKSNHPNQAISVAQRFLNFQPSDPSTRTNGTHKPLTVNGLRFRIFGLRRSYPIS